MTALAVVSGLIMAGSALAAPWPNGVSLLSGWVGGASPYQANLLSEYPDVSADGRYAVFSSASSGLNAAAPNGGVFRKDLQDDSAPVAVVAELLPLAGGVQCGATGNASVSADGRYVTFASGENGLVAGDNNDRRDVFVRDMNKAPGDAGAYELVSAPDGGDAGATYELPTDAVGGAIPAAESCLHGAELPKQSNAAISNDGTRVLFTNTAFTNMFADAGNGTAPGQLMVRDRDASPKSTTLVTRVNYDVPWNEDEVDPPLDVGDPLPDSEYFDVGENDDSIRPIPLASLSGDGSTVVWNGTMARVQTEFHTVGEDLTYSQAGSFDSYTLLWRHIDDGPSAPTRRVTGWVDLDDPGCNHSLATFDPSLTPETPGEEACAGPFDDDMVLPVVEMDPARNTPELTFDGRNVFFLTDRKRRNVPAPNVSQFDLYMADMAPGVSRKLGLTVVTRAIGQLFEPGGITIESFTTAGDGKRVAVRTRRRDFQLNLTEIAPFPVSVAKETAFVIDRGNAADFNGAEIEWVGRPPGDVDPQASVGSRFALDHDGDTFVFTSAATNLYPAHNGKAQALCVRKSGTPCIGTVAGPAAPTITVPADGLHTADATLSFAGTAVAGSLVTVLDGEETICSDAADGAGAWACDAAGALADGDYSFVAKATDDSMVTSAAGSAVSVTIDTVAPAAPSIVSPVTGSTVGDRTPAIQGTAEPGATVTLFVDTVENGTTTADGSGNWTFTPSVLLSLGNHAIGATATDAAGNEGSASSITLTIDQADPVISAPTSGSVTADSTPLISGTGEPGESVAVVEGLVTLCNALVAGTGSWSCTPGVALAEGPHTIAATQSTSTSASVTFTVDTTPPPLPPDTTPPPTPTPPAPQLELLVAKALASGTATIPATVNVAGSIGAIGTAKLPKGKKMKSQTAGTGTATATGAGNVAIAFKLNALAKKQLKKKRKLAVSVTVTFTSASGEKVVKTTKLNFSSKKK